MNRKNKFRGMRVGSNEWVCGDLIHDKNGLPHIAPQNQSFDFDDDRFEIYEVIPVTVGQFTGLHDRDGAEIWEGDVLEKVGEEGFGAQEGYGAYNDTPFGSRDVATMERFPRFWLKNEMFGYEGDELENPNGWVVIGNIHNNPELRKDE